MYLDQPGRPLGAGHESAGVTAPATQWFLAEGATGAYFDLFILIANPGDGRRRAGRVPARRRPGHHEDVHSPANSRFNIWVDLEDPALANAALSTRITRPTACPSSSSGRCGGRADVGHLAGGAQQSRRDRHGTRWALAEGEVGGPRETETYVLVANTSPLAGTIGRPCCSRTAAGGDEGLRLIGQHPLQHRARRATSRRPAASASA